MEPLKKVLRAATEQDLSNVAKNREKEKEAAAVAADRIGRLGLEMKLVGVEYTFDASKSYSISRRRTGGFQELIKELASAFSHPHRAAADRRARRNQDDGRGWVPAGREICCAGFMDKFSSGINPDGQGAEHFPEPTKISGLCGRLMCCWSSRYQHYHNMRGKLPPKGAEC